jgi:hypothetical protein
MTSVKPESTPYVKMPVDCAFCHTKQTVHIVAREGFAQVGSQTVVCINCKREFEVTVMDRIIEGPFKIE